MVVQSDAYLGIVRTLLVAEVTSNLSMASDPACLFIDVSTPDGKATGLARSSVVSCLVLATIDANNVAHVLGTLSTSLRQRLNDWLKVALQLS